MKNYLVLLLFFFTAISCYSDTIEGRVSEQGSQTMQHRIIDKQTGLGIDNADILFPKENFATKTDKDGYFDLDANINGTSIMSVKKEKYKPYSMTVNKHSFDKPIEVSIEKSNPNDTIIDLNMYHLGDGSYSDNSANAGEFTSGTIRPFYSKKFNLKNINLNAPTYLVIGSIIGIDTLMARTMNQNRMPNAYASPPEVYFNGNKVAEIQINGDGQRIKLPPNLIKKNGVNEVTIKTGRNLMQTAYIDYDDIEFMNISIEN